jgi:hypothetical protein
MRVEVTFQHKPNDIITIFIGFIYFKSLAMWAGGGGLGG